MDGETGKEFGVLARLMELADQSRRINDRLKGASPDPETQAELQSMAREADSIAPSEGGAAGQFREAAEHARHAVELLSESPPNVQNANEELSMATSNVAGGLGVAILAALVGKSNLSTRALQEIMQVSNQLMQRMKAIRSTLTPQTTALSKASESIAALAASLEDFAIRVEGLETQHETP